jgi:hypothetical protein
VSVQVLLRILCLYSILVSFLPLFIFLFSSFLLYFGFLCLFLSFSLLVSLLPLIFLQFCFFLSSFRLFSLVLPSHFSLFLSHLSSFLSIISVVFFRPIYLLTFGLSENTRL